MIWHRYRSLGVRLLALVLLSLALIVSRAEPAWSLLLTSEAILNRAEQALTHPEGVVWTLNVDVDEGERSLSRTLLVTAKGANVLAEMLRPREMQGQLILRSGDRFWAINPGVALPDSLKPSNSYLGPVSYACLMPIDLLANYEVEEVGEDSAYGEACFLFIMRGRKGSGEYDTLRVWISKSRLVAVKINFYTPSGRFLKSAYLKYEHEALVDGEMRPFLSDMDIRSGIFSDASAVLEWSPPQFLNIPADTFELRTLLGQEAYEELQREEAKRQHTEPSTPDRNETDGE